ncbi:MAG TPA: beta-galactosidase GalB [Verrucomicrobiae bacterium]|jgi:beta-galactosidase
MKKLHFKIFTCAAAIILGCNIVAAAAPAMPREKMSFDSDWRFSRNTSEDGSLTYTNIRSWVMSTGSEFVKDGQVTPRPDGNLSSSYAGPGFDDSAWQQVTLPHDWAIAGPFDINAPGETGKLPWEGVGWYRKHFTVPASDEGYRIYLDIDGAMSYANVWINGQYVGGWPYGYQSWQLDLTPYLKFGADNVVAIRLDNPPDSSRWYPGAGIDRNVWLEKTSPIHVGHWGTYVTTPDISPSAATVNIQATVDNDSDSNNALSVRNEIYELNADDSFGKRVGDENLTWLPIPAHTNLMSECKLTVPNPKLWSLEKPQRYVVVTTLEKDGQIVDRYQTPFGIRTIKFDADKGFFLNGEHVFLSGVCDHADLGALGTAINTRALERQIQILKEMGCNAIRTSHNPPAPELLDLCDRMGMLVMDESFDCWQKGKRPNDYHLLFADWHEKDWRAELHRDRNHPSIILWSVGNEVPDQNSLRGDHIAAELTRIAHEEDPTRPTTAACDHIPSGFDGFETNLDVFGYNYKPFEYTKVHAANPGLPIIGSENASTISTRGEYDYPVNTNKSDGKFGYQMSSYDLSAPYWSNIPDLDFKGEYENPFVAGEFVWTGFDYIGEPTPYDAKGDPSRSSYFGIVDLAGFKKDRFYLYQSHWRPDFPMAHIVPQNWNWPNRIGQVTPVYVYTSGDSAELFLNGKSLGLLKKGPEQYRLCWNDVQYQPGELKVVAYKNGHRWADSVVKTTGPAAKLALTADRTKIHADGQDLSYITVAVEDKNGLVMPEASNSIHFAVSGPAQIVATDNGDATDLTSFPSHERKAFHGLALVIIRSLPGETGSITVTAISDELKTATVRVKSE